jgi:hypothetical protein
MVPVPSSPLQGTFFNRLQSFAVVPQLAQFGVSLLARLGVVRLLSKLDPASPELPPQERAQIDALTPSTRQVYLRRRVYCPHPNAQTGESGEPGEQTAGGGHCRQIGAQLAQAAG